MEDKIENNLKNNVVSNVNPFKVPGNKQRKLLYKSKLNTNTITDEEIIMFIREFCCIEDIDGIVEFKSKLLDIKNKIKRKNNIMSYMQTNDIVYYPVCNKFIKITIITDINIEYASFLGKDEHGNVRYYSMYDCLLESELLKSVLSE